jgi:hypothetical protein
MFWYTPYQRNATTRTGEGFNQEIAQHYTKTNCREAEGQVGLLNAFEILSHSLNRLLAKMKTRKLSPVLA